MPKKPAPPAIPQRPVALVEMTNVRRLAEQFRCTEHDVREAIDVVGADTNEILAYVKAKRRRARRNESPPTDGDASA